MSGDDTFMRGLNVYLSRHRFANAAFADPVAAIADVLGDPVHDWVEVWLRSTGFDTLSVGRDGDVPVLSRDGSRPHRLRVNAYDESWHEVGAGMVELDAESETPAFAGRVAVPNDLLTVLRRQWEDWYDDLVLSDLTWCGR